MSVEEAAMPDIRLPQGTIRYRDEGQGAPVVFIHGLLVDGRLWDGVVSRLGEGVRAIVPDLPLGAHAVPMEPGADLTPPGLARLIADFLAALDLEDVTLVANDTGGALAELVVTRHPERVGRLVLTPCDAFENFFPPLFRPLVLVGAHVPGAVTLILRSLRLAPVARSPLGLGWLTKKGPDMALVRDLARPGLADAGVRRDVRKVLRGIDKAHTLDAAARLRTFGRPVLIAWTPEDRVFPYAHAERLATIFPDATLAPIEDSYAFVPLDQPGRLAELVTSFARTGAPTPA